MWDWIQQLSGGGGSFLGALAGSFFGLIAILLGALYNAHLNRQRDDRLRLEDSRALAAALVGELSAIVQACRRNLKWNEKFVEQGKAAAKTQKVEYDEVQLDSRVFGLKPVLETPIFDANAGQLGALGTSLSCDLADVYQTIASWRWVEEKKPFRTLSTYIDTLPSIEAHIAEFEHVALRLTAFQEGRRLPESLQEFRARTSVDHDG